MAIFHFEYTFYTSSTRNLVGWIKLRIEMMPWPKHFRCGFIHCMHQCILSCNQASWQYQPGLWPIFFWSIFVHCSKIKFVDNLIENAYQNLVCQIDTEMWINALCLNHLNLEPAPRLWIHFVSVFQELKCVYSSNQDYEPINNWNSDDLSSS